MSNCTNCNQPLSHEVFKTCFKCRAAARRWQQRNKARVKQNKRRWNKANRQRCAEQARKGHRKSMQASGLKDWRRRILNQIKRQEGCAECGYNVNANALCFHHVDRKNKRGKIQYNHTWPWIIEELQKCIVLCQNCHHILHAGQCLHYRSKV